MGAGDKARLDLGIALEPLENDSSVIYALDRDLRLAYCNPSWDRFALENDGSSVQSCYVLGQPVLSVIPGVLLQFYKRAYGYVRSNGVAWEHDYECSSERRYRLFRMRILLLERTNGFLVLNSKIVDRWHLPDRQEYTPDPVYESEPGGITVCSHCRRTARGDFSGAWDWVPMHLRWPATQVSHGLCPFCCSFLGINAVEEPPKQS